MRTSYEKTARASSWRVCQRRRSSISSWSAPDEPSAMELSSALPVEPIGPSRPALRTSRAGCCQHRDRRSGGRLQSSALSDTLWGMCRQVTCRKCGRPTWKGCGAHVEQVLHSVPVAERCRCSSEKTPRPATTKRKSWFSRRATLGQQRAAAAAAPAGDLENER